MVRFLRGAAPTKLTGKVVVFGATTVVGQPLSLLLKLCPHVEEVCCCSVLKKKACEVGVVSARGIAADLSHIDTPTVVKTFDDPCNWELALHGAQLVLVCSGSTFDPLRVHRDIALADTAAELVLIMEAVSKAAPSAIVGIVSSPVNALVPLAREVLQRRSVFDPRKLFGVTTLDVIRIRTLVAEELKINSYDVNVPVVGGRGGITACPLVAQTGLRIPHERIVQMSEQLQAYGAPVTDDADCDGASGNEHALSVDVAPPVGLSLAYAALEWSVSVLKALRGDYGITECGFVESTMRKETPFFGSRVVLGREGVEQLLPIGPLTPYETELVETAVASIAEDVEAGFRFAAGKAK
ncbi:putative malate dehydrogenase [Trypanosoma grayi]|uniref:putative malate dehydrogenase n=1 Tax=Trypanosoma grayi TaxID=71804 RepID=UPI0004F45AF7|nr:putative malate dehydrogenase [Trypanosoma grayi]KEG09756.1 putative malate dehydrogenase [Trypanosoma grayi]